MKESNQTQIERHTLIPSATGSAEAGPQVTGSPGPGEKVLLFEDVFQEVIKNLPTNARERLERFWAAQMATNPITGERAPAPMILFGEGWTQQLAVLGINSLANAGDGRCMIFDYDFVTGAPREVLATLIAHELGHALAKASDEQEPETERRRERTIKHKLRRWGYEENEIELWQAAKTAAPSQPVTMYYAYRWARFNRPPPRTADLHDIARVLRAGGRSDLAQKAKALAETN